MCHSSDFMILAQNAPINYKFTFLHFSSCMGLKKQDTVGYLVSFKHVGRQMNELKALFRQMLHYF